MRLLAVFAALAGLSFVGCNRSEKTDTASSVQSEDPAKLASSDDGTDSSPPASIDRASAKAAAARQATASKPSPKTAYRLLGILDPDRERMVAFALKVPRDWQAQQEFHRIWDGQVGLPQISITLNAPDGRSQIAYFPSSQYIYGDGPLSNSLRAQKQSMGLPTQVAPNELAPMPPIAYLKNVVLPMMAQNGVTLRELGNERVAPDVDGDNGVIKSRGSIDATLPSGNRARIEVRLSTSSRQIGSDVYHSWTAVPSISQSSNDLESIHAHTRVAQDSIVLNPAWVRLEQDAQSRGMQANSVASRQQHEATMNQIHANTAAMTRGHEQRMAAIRQFGEANTARFNQRMNDMDRDQRIRVDTIRGESQYVNPTTGERSKVADGYNHVYTNEQHPQFFLGTDTPINAGELDWQELQKVQLSEY